MLPTAQLEVLPRLHCPRAENALSCAHNLGVMGNRRTGKIATRPLLRPKMAEGIQPRTSMALSATRLRVLDRLCGGSAIALPSIMGPGALASS